MIAPDDERVPVLVGCATLVAGVAMAARPGLVTGSLGLDETHELPIRLIGVSDLVLVPGLLRGEPRWPWMFGRAAANLAIAAYLHTAAGGSSRPGVVQALKGTLLALTAADGSSGLALRRR